MGVIFWGKGTSEWPFQWWKQLVSFEVVTTFEINLAKCMCICNVIEIHWNKSSCFSIKVYTVGPDYAHAEARKSPALDGKVERDSEGKEVRYPVILNAREKLIAWKVCLAFKVSWLLSYLIKLLVLINCLLHETAIGF